MLLFNKSRLLLKQFLYPLAYNDRISIEALEINWKFDVKWGIGKKLKRCRVYLKTTIRVNFFDILTCLPILIKSSVL